MKEADNKKERNVNEITFIYKYSIIFIFNPTKFSGNLCDSPPVAFCDTLPSLSKEQPKKIPVDLRDQWFPDTLPSLETKFSEQEKKHQTKFSVDLRDILC